jgi:hypothetical protein
MALGAFPRPSSIMPPNTAPLDLESIPTILSETKEQLEEVWSAVGYSESERKAQIHSLLSSIQALCSQKISEERLVRDQFSHSIASARASIISTSKALHRPVPEACLQDADTLTSTLTAVSDIVDSLNSAASGARKSIAQAKDTINTKHAALGTEPAPEFTKADEDLSDATVAMFEEEARTVSEVVDTRVGVIVQVRAARSPPLILPPPPPP